MSESIVLLHGLGRTGASMIPLAIAARLRGYSAVIFNYRSRSRSIAEHAVRLERVVRKAAASSDRVHFVTHSLGGIIVRQMMATAPFDRCGRVVMLGPPNRGSEVVDMLRAHCMTHPFLGKSGLELGTDDESTPNSLPPVAIETGVIAGTRSNNRVFSGWIGAPNDGKVAVHRAGVDGMRDLLVLARTHTFMIWSPDAIRQALHFIAHGAFAAAK
jgi:triacylglycerol lipase